MKKVFYATLALGALIFASCQKENSAVLPKVDSPVFTATLDTDSDTKTELVETQDGKKKSEWRSGDAIRVLNQDGDAAEYTAQNSGATATFTTTEKGFTGTKFVALYPAAPAGDVTWESPSVLKKLWLTDTQSTVEGGGYDPNAHIAVAYTGKTNFVFKNAVALLKVSVLGTGINKISVSSTGEKIVGNFSYDFTTGDISTDESGYYNPSTVTLSGTFTDGKDYYIAILPGTYSAFELSVNGISVKKKTGSVKFNSGKIYDLGSVRAPFNWGVVGGMNSWTVSEPIVLFDTDEDGIFELKEQDLTGGFKFVRLPDCTWADQIGVHSESFVFDTEMKGSWYQVYTNNKGDKDKNIVVSDTSTKWDIYIYAPTTADWGQEIKFTVVPTGSTTPSKS